MMDSDEEKLVMTREEMRKYIQKMVKEKQRELLNPGTVQNSSFQSLTERRDRRLTAFQDLCQSVEECEASMKELYTLLTMEYKDTDSEDETQVSINSEEGAVANGFDGDVDTVDDDDDDADAADNSDMTPNSPAAKSQHRPQTSRVEDSHKRPQRDEPSTSLQLKLKPVVLLSQLSLEMIRRPLPPRAARLKQRKEKKVVEEEEDEPSDCDSEDSYKPKEDVSDGSSRSSNSSGSEWSYSGSDSKKKREKHKRGKTMTPQVMPQVRPQVLTNVTSAVQQKITFTPSSKVTFPQTNITTTKIMPKLNGGDTCALVVSSISQASNPVATKPPDLPDEEVKVGMEILAMRKPSSWERGKITEIITKDGVQKYKVDLGTEKTLLSGHHIAFSYTPALERLYVGARVVAKYQEAEKSWLQAGILVELPNRKNRMRFLVFFDDSSPSYVGLPLLHLVCRPLEDVSEGLTDETHKAFVQEYLKVWPNPALAQYRVGQTLNVEFDGALRKCEVDEMDCSLIQVSFKEGEEHKEWIYRGSNRLEHIVNMKKHSEENKHGQRKENTPFISPPVTSTQTIHPSKPPQTSPVSASTSAKKGTEERIATPIPTSKLVRYSPHRCCPACLDQNRPKDAKKPHIERNPLLAPLFYGFHRVKARKKNGTDEESTHLYYKTPCGLCLTTMAKVQDYLFKTRCDFLSLEMFCLDPEVSISLTRKPLRQVVLNLDFANGKELRKISCVNELNRERPPSLMYRKDRVATDGISINTSPDFLVGCDCTDGCGDSVVCSCMQLTVQSTSLSTEGPVDQSAGYSYKRLYNHIVTGVYECNALCRCDPSMCSNRVVQHGIQVRLEVFKTDNRGWGVRCLDDVAIGTFVCTFSGRIQNRGQKNLGPNEYCVKLNHIEAAEIRKEDYETEAYCSDSEPAEDQIDSDSVPSTELRFTTKSGYSTKSKEATVRLEKDSRKRTQKDPKKTAGPAKKSHSTSKEKGPEKSTTPVTTTMTRHLFAGETQCYVVNASLEGNVARFFNHSCSPNMFVQNVFVDTHDIRFPWLAFFTSEVIKSGTELTWNYRSIVGGADDVSNGLHCHCGSETCHGKL